MFDWKSPRFELLGENAMVGLGDCLELMKDIPDQSVDMILTDPPYGTTACRWDSIIPFEPMWKELKRIIKPNGAICLFGSEPFSSLLRCSNLDDYKYDWIWKKDKPTGHLNAKKQPMRQTENISVFYGKQCSYFPQFSKKNLDKIRPPTKRRKNTGVYGEMDKDSVRGVPVGVGYPKNIIKFNSCFENADKGLHPTQKPIALLEYLIRTYTQKGQIVLDFTMGSGSCGVSCRNLGRKFIGIEKDEEYFSVAKNMITPPKIRMAIIQEKIKQRICSK